MSAREGELWGDRSLQVSRVLQSDVQPVRDTEFVPCRVRGCLHERRVRERRRDPSEVLLEANRRALVERDWREVDLVRHAVVRERRFLTGNA